MGNWAAAAAAAAAETSGVRTQNFPGWDRPVKGNIEKKGEKDSVKERKKELEKEVEFLIWSWEFGSSCYTNRSIIGWRKMVFSGQNIRDKIDQKVGPSSSFFL